MFKSNVTLALGVRPHQYKFSMADYHEYIATRNEIVQSYQDRAALLYGSLVWRLAHESHADKTDVLRGPSDFHTMRDYHCLDNTHFMDDVLSAHQLDIMCGVYRVLGPHETDIIPGAAYRSWWPSVHVWENSGMEVDC
ncbi:hypothetical protein BDY19DRAFT_885521 [Irpex rosettiformis]|uniref:Uncharacterized protein n=1 Tax=Irpex rosettiformis TaxID=378272 RepID=A0ACB8UC42_9APHY|nr:hypothetical protein BDY19DRAFT_885521 [Irpex rosettiformis]